MLATGEKSPICSEEGFNNPVADMYLSIESIYTLCSEEVNMTFQKGYKLTAESEAKRRKNISKSLTGKHLSEETKQKLSVFHKGKTPWNKGVPCSEEQKHKISLKRKGQKLSEETRKKISASSKGHPRYNKNPPWNKGTKGLVVAHNKGKPMLPHVKKALMEANKNRVISTETRKKLSELHKGKRLSEEHKAKLKLVRAGDKNYNWKGGRKFSNARSKARRKRDLDFIPLNDCDIKSWVGHHLDEQYVLYIPKELHKSIPHALKNQENMNKINQEAIKWYTNYYGLNLSMRTAASMESAKRITGGN